MVDGTEELHPTLASRDFTVGKDYTNKILGLDLSSETIQESLEKMGLIFKGEQEDQYTVEVPPLRSDILHACDIVEDVGIAYGYNNIPLTTPQSHTLGQALPINKFSDHLRAELAQAGYHEILSFGLVSKKEQFEFIKEKWDPTKAVELANSKSKEFDFCRNTLLIGLLKTVNARKSAALPHKIFEVSDVVIPDESTEQGARNERRVGAVFSNKTSGMEQVHGVLDCIMERIGVKWDKNGDGSGYHLEESEENAFFPGRRFRVMLKGEKIGVMGTVHPEVLDKFKIITPCSALELNVEKLFEHFER